MTLEILTCFLSTPTKEDLPSFPSQFPLTPELHLLIASSWQPPKALQVKQVEQISRLINDGIDWEVFLTLVKRHDVPALVHAALTCHAAGKIPVSIHAQLKERSDRARLEALKMAAETVRVLRLLDEASIETLALKGASLSYQLFGDPALRHSTDIDLLVRPADLERADQLLRAEGWESPVGELTPRQRAFVVTVNHEFGYIHNRTGVGLELQWQHDLWTPGQVEELWRHRRLLDIGGEQVATLDDDALLLYLCSHGANHKWFRLKWLGDVAAILARERTTGWDALLALAARLGLRRSLAQAALLVHWLYGVTLPSPLCQLIASEQKTSSLCNASIASMLLTDEEHSQQSRRLAVIRNLVYYPRLKPDMPLRPYLMKILISETDFQEFRLPDWLFWFYCPLRPVLWMLRNYSKPTR